MSVGSSGTTAALCRPDGGLDDFDLFPERDVDATVTCTGLHGPGAVDSGRANTAAAMPPLNDGGDWAAAGDRVASIASLLGDALGQATIRAARHELSRIVLTCPDRPLNADVDERFRDQDALAEAIAQQPMPSAWRLCWESLAAMECFVRSASPPLPPAAVVVNLRRDCCTTSLYLRSESGGYVHDETAAGADDSGTDALEGRVATWLSTQFPERGESTAPEVGDAAGSPITSQIRDAIDVLAAASEVEIPLGTVGDPHTVVLTREQFSEVSLDYIEAVAALAQQMLHTARSRRTSDGPTAIIMTGALARHPALRGRIAGIGAERLADLGDPRTVVARGAALLGAAPHGEPGQPPKSVPSTAHPVPGQPTWRVRWDDDGEFEIVWDGENHDSPPLAGGGWQGVGGGQPTESWGQGAGYPDSGIPWTPPEPQPGQYGAPADYRPTAQGRRADPIPGSSRPSAQYGSHPALGSGGHGSGGLLRTTVDSVRSRLPSFARRNRYITTGEQPRIVLLDPATAGLPTTDVVLSETQAVAPPARERELQAEISRDGERCAKVLSPDCVHRLDIWIGVPAPDRDPETTLSVSFDATQLPEEETVQLDVVVSTADGSWRKRDSLFLPMRDRTQDSTTATVEFTTGGEGPLRLNIDVTYRGRPIRSAVLDADVRARAGLRDKIRLLGVPLSGPSEPDPRMTAADATLDVSGELVRRPEDDRAVPLAQIRTIAAAFEQRASNVLGVLDAPESLTDPRALSLLIDLARLGHRLAAVLAPLELQDARSIAMKVRASSVIVPLELAYDGPPPEANAKLCSCVVALDAPEAARTRRHATAGRVCPYAFWGMNRLIIRTVAGQPVQRLQMRRSVSPLSLAPVLYGAADKADEASPVNALPSRALERALTERGATCITVRDWKKWCGAVKRDKPELLVVLGHAETNKDEVDLHIGKRSVLRQGSITAKYLLGKEGPPPLVMLFACSSAATADIYGPLSGTFVDNGAAAVIASLTKFRGSHAAAAAEAVLTQMHAQSGQPRQLAAALHSARRELIADGLLIGLLLVPHGEIDLQFVSRD
ncbi:CHAT domain-containing protein [Mycobacterium sp. GA-2829]|uniref:CHAT domain-containing protein n=1 Tax=Mycobacterium sp. GA-2829 TaxID=1772283 RepID=UPI0018D22C21|nr:CHAT domain-containing protein [Mycobacterium sp. GA-2829]